MTCGTCGTEMTPLQHDKYNPFPAISILFLVLSIICLVVDAYLMPFWGWSIYYIILSIASAILISIYRKLEVKRGRNYKCPFCGCEIYKFNAREDDKE